MVGGFNPSEKKNISQFQLGWLFPYIMDKYKMFQTTNQYIWILHKIDQHIYRYR